MRVVLAGEESAGLHVLRWLAATEHEVVAVLAGSERKKSPVAGAAARLGHTVRPAKTVREDAFAGWLERERVDLLLNVHSLFKIAAAVLEAPRIGSFNLHPGPLPRYAGLNAPSWAIYCGETHFGTTVHWMTPEIDAGAIAYQEFFEITPEDTGLSVSMRCIELGVPLVSRVVEAAASGSGAIPRIAQDLSERTYFPPGPPDGGRVSWSAPVRTILDFVRAANFAPFPSPWGHPWTMLGEERLELTKASSTGEPTEGAAPGTVGLVGEEGAHVAAADEWMLLERLRVAGATALPAELLKGGMRLGA